MFYFCPYVLYRAQIDVLTGQLFTAPKSHVEPFIVQARVLRDLDRDQGDGLLTLALMFLFSGGLLKVSYIASRNVCSASYTGIGGTPLQSLFSLPLILFPN